MAPAFAPAKRVSGSGLYRRRWDGLGNWLVAGLTVAALPFAATLGNSHEQILAADKGTPSEINWPGAF